MNYECKCIVYLFCSIVSGYYARKTLRRHVKRCDFNTNRNLKVRHQSASHTLMADHFGPNDPLRTGGVLDTLQADEISLVAKRDKIICEVARKYVKSHKEKHLVQVARRYMRRLARLLIEIRTIEKNNHLSLASILHPSKFKVIVQATRQISDYNASTKSFKSPSLALQMGTLLKKCLNAAYSIEIQKDINSPTLNVLNIMKQLIDDEWATEVSTEAGQNLNLNRFNKPTLIPVTEDLQKMKIYLDNLISHSMIQLKANNSDEVAFRQLIEGTYCNVLLFNKRRVGELQRILVETYVKHLDGKSSGEFENLLSPSEKILVKNLKRIVIKGKRGRGVPVLFDRTTCEALDLTVQFREIFFQNNNIYLFPQLHSETCISGYHIFRKHVNLALKDSNKTATFTSTKLRKHLATISQILKMGPDELEQLATFMGHTTKTHQEWYRLPADIYQTAKVSKILLLSQNSNIDKFKGRNINDLNVGDELLESQNDSDTDEETIPINDTGDVVRETIQETQTHVQNNKKKIIRNRWTAEEKRVTEEYFRRHIRLKQAPKKNEVLQLVESYPHLFKNRKWDSIKVYVCNVYSKRKIAE